MHNNLIFSKYFKFDLFLSFVTIRFEDIARSISDAIRVVDKNRRRLINSLFSSLRPQSLPTSPGRVRAVDNGQSENFF